MTRRRLMDPATWSGLPGLPWGTRRSYLHVLAWSLVQVTVASVFFADVVPVAVRAMMLLPVGVGAWGFGRRAGVATAAAHIVALTFHDLYIHPEEAVAPEVMLASSMLMIAVGWFIGDLSTLVARTQADARELAHLRAVLGRTLDGIDQGVAQYDAQGNLVYANRRFTEAHARTQGELAGDGHLRVFGIDPHGKHAAAALQGKRTLREEELTFDCMVDASGAPRYWDATAQPVSDPTGEFAVVTLADVTERHADRIARDAAERRLRESEDQFRQIGDNLDQVLFIVSADASQLYYINPAVERLTGLTAQQAAEVPLGWLAQLDDQDRETLLTALGELVATGRPAAAEYTWVRTTDASKRRLRIKAFPVVGADGALGRIVGVISDVTEARDAEERLRLSNARLADAQRVSKTGSWEYDLRTKDLHWSDETYRIYDQDPATFQPTYERYYALLAPEESARVEEAWLTHVASGIPLDIVHRITTPDGQTRHVRLRCETSRDAEGRPIVATGTVQDVTELTVAHEKAAGEEAIARELEKAREVSAFKTTFLNTAAHELATPLTPIEFELDLLRSDRSQLTKEQREALDVLSRSIQRVTGLVRDLLDAARLESGRLKVTLQRGSLRPAILEAVSQYATLAHEAGITLKIEVDSDDEVGSDRARVVQVVSNLIDNAIKYTPNGGTVRVVASRVGDEVLVSVTDTGRGLTPGQAAKLFTPFSQVHVEGPFRGSGGTGLGLFICKGIIESHGGRIWCASEGPGKGSTFAFALPVVGQASEASPAPVTANA